MTDEIPFVPIPDPENLHRPEKMIRCCLLLLIVLGLAMLALLVAAAVILSSKIPELLQATTVPI